MADTVTFRSTGLRVKAREELGRTGIVRFGCAVMPIPATMFVGRFKAS